MAETLSPESRLKSGAPWLTGAAVLGALVAVIVDRAVRDEDPPPPAVARAAAAGEGPPPVPVDPAPARSLVADVLVGLGVSAKAIDHGLYPLRGPGRRTEETIPLVSFTCPAGTSCPAVFAMLEAKARGLGFEVVGSRGGDRPGRPVFRAFAQDGRPALAVRAFPAGPRLALVVSGVGREPGLLDALLALDPHVTFAVAANAPHAAEIARRLAATRREVVAHLPMEPTRPDLRADFDGFITTSMAPAEIGTKVDELLGRVPGAVGASNLLGSRLTTSRPHMSAVLERLKARSLYYLDNRASPASVAQPTARLVGVRTAIRTHFLDAGDDLDARLKSIEVALVLEGHAVVVAPPAPDMLLALQGWVRGLKERRIHVFRLSEIVL